MNKRCSDSSVLTYIYIYIYIYICIILHVKCNLQYTDAKSNVVKVCKGLYRKTGGVDEIKFPGLSKEKLVDIPGFN